MEVLGPRLEYLEMRDDIELTPQFEIAAAKCTNLKGIIISKCTHELPALLEILFEGKKHELTSVNLGFQSNASFGIRQSFSDSLDMLALHCTNLRSFSIGTAIFDLDALRNFAESSPELREVHIHIMDASQIDHPGEDVEMDHLAITTSAIESFAMCPKISRLCITADRAEYEVEVEDVTNACSSLRHKGVHVSFNDFVYLK